MFNDYITPRTTNDADLCLSCRSKASVCTSNPFNLCLQVGDGWCEGTYDGKKGMFPDNFVQLKPASVPFPAVTAAREGNSPPPDSQPSDPTPIDPPVVTKQAGTCILHCLFYGNLLSHLPFPSPISTL